VINSGRFDTIPGGTAGFNADIAAFSKVLKDYGLDPPASSTSCIVEIPPGLLEHPKHAPEIRSTIEKAMRSQLKDKPRFLLVLLPNQSALLYDMIKFLLDLKYGIPSICCIGSKFHNKSDQYYANVVMKFNQKLGGVNHMVDIKSMAPLDTQTIIFGIDVTHPSPGSSESAPSIAGVVASVDAMFTQYPASMRRQKPREEMVLALEEMIIERLQLWQKRNQGK
jgi:hypothetical protein